MTSVDEVLAVYDRWGRERYDEDVSQVDHERQAAAPDEPPPRSPARG